MTSTLPGGWSGAGRQYPQQGRGAEAPQRGAQIDQIGRQKWLILPENHDFLGVFQIGDELVHQKPRGAGVLPVQYLGVRVSDFHVCVIEEAVLVQLDHVLAVFGEHLYLLGLGQPREAGVHRPHHIP